MQLASFHCTWIVLLLRLIPLSDLSLLLQQLFLLSISPTPSLSLLILFWERHFKLNSKMELKYIVNKSHIILLSVISLLWVNQIHTDIMEDTTMMLRLDWTLLVSSTKEKEQSYSKMARKSTLISPMNSIVVLWWVLSSKKVLVKWYFLMSKMGSLVKSNSVKSRRNLQIISQEISYKKES